MKNTSILNVLMALFVFVAGLSVSKEAQAQFSGQWSMEKGQVQLIINKQDQGVAPCHVMDLSLNESDAQLSIQNFHLECGEMLVIEMSPMTLDKAGGLLSFDGQIVGKYTSDQLQFRFTQKGLTREVVLQKKSENTLSLFHDWTDGFNQLLFNASLSK